MNKTRNPNATCGNCPYWDISEDDETIGRCRHECASVGQEKDGKLYRAWMFYSYDLDWCGNHPDFWQTEAPEETAALIDPSNSLDAYVWAKAFCQRFGGDEMLMLSWFANAIERGRDAGRGATDREQQLRADLAKRDAVIARLVEAVEQMIEMGHADNAKDDGVTMKSTVARMLVMKKLQAAIDAAKEVLNHD